MPQTKRSTRGSALLTALFIMSLVAIVAMAMSAKIQSDLYRTQLLLTHDKLYLATQAVRFWALDQLHDKKNKFSNANVQGMIAQFPAPLKPRDYTVTLSGALYDLQARYNLNNVVQKKSMIGFMNLLNTSNPKLDETEQLKLIQALKHWVSPYDPARDKDSYLSYYLNQKPPYSPSHQLMSSRSELRLVKNFNASVYIALEPFITALPEYTPINVNTAPLPVLQSLTNTRQDEPLKKLIAARKHKGFQSMRELSEILNQLDISEDQITLESTYFLSAAYASSDTHQVSVYTLFKRIRDKKGKLLIHILRESSNVY